MHYKVLVWAEALWTTAGGKNFPPFLISIRTACKAWQPLSMRRGGNYPCGITDRGNLMRKLSVFIDESGDFGEIKERPAYYLVTFVFHDQNNSIDQEIKKLEAGVRDAGFQVEYIHTGPVIRREEVFSVYSIDERRKLLYKMLNFVNACPVSYLTVVIDRKEAADKVSLSGRLARAIHTAMGAYRDYFAGFDRIIVYYDNGQSELSAILNAVFSIQFSNVEFRKAQPQKYRLLQAADFICTMELLRIKRDEKRLSRSEEQFFYKPQELKKTFLKSLEKKRL